jgi:Domain of unknown function (DUF4424)
MKLPILALAAIASAIAAVSWAGNARADDAGVSSTPTGDLVFVKNDSIEMFSEDLTIAVDKVRVDYVFKNNASADITMKIGFPVPILTIGGDRSEFAFRLPHDQNFTAWVDGKPITANMNVRVGTLDFTRANGDPLHGKWVDLTDKFNVLGLDPFNADAVPPGAMATLRALGLVCYSQDEPHDEVGACWNIKKTYSWDMIFPAHREISIRHEYKPWKGSFPDMTGAMEAYCPDQGFKNAVEKTRNTEKLEEANVDFILKTAANWSGPIRSFTLKVDKAGASLVSFCPIPGLKLVRSGNMFVGTAKDFAPQSDISIYFLGHGISTASELEGESKH